MIYFFEGLPRAGKSYTAASEWILKAILKGRHVVTNIDGFNIDMAAELTGVDVERVRELVKLIGDEEMPRVYEFVVKDALYVLDEAQDYWPSSFKPLSKPMTTFVTKHGHDGIDIILMGQDLNDVHNIWKRRIDRKYVFQKKDVIGKPNEFKWTVYKKVKGQKGDRFEKVSDGSGEYEEKYFGLYKSHTDGTTNTDTLEDGNANVLKTKVFRVWIPLFALVAFGAIGFLVYLFKGGGLVGSKPEDKHVVTTTVATSSTPPTVAPEKVTAAGPAKASDAAAKPDPEDDDFIAGLAKKYRPRLEGWARVRGHADVIVAWYDDSTRVRERLSAATVEDLGWKVQESQYGQHVILAKGERRIVVTMWPIDIYGKVPEKQVDGVRAMSGADTRAARDERAQDFGPQGWRANDDQVMGRGVVDLPPSITNIPDDAAPSRHLRRSTAYDGTQHWSHG